MTKSSYLRQHWKMIINIITIVALVVLVFFLRSEIVGTFENLRKVDSWALLLLIPIELWNYDAQARLYKSLFQVLGNTVSYRGMYEVALELNFINSVFPSAGISGVSYFGVRLRSETDKITGGKASLVQMLKLMIVLVSFEVLLILGLLFLALGGHVNNLTILVASSVSTLLVIGTFAFIYILGSKTRINATFGFITKVLNWVINLFRPGKADAIHIERVRMVVNELHNNYKLVHANYRLLKKPFLFATMANLSEVLAIYAVYIAFGHWINIGAVILAYAVANFAGFISVLPGGIGVYEALMTAVLAISGVPASLSIPVVIMYRVLNTLIQVPPGYYFYHKTLRSQPKEANNASA
jgi:uncharacterized protein (TIRG00374 family)